MADKLTRDNTCGAVNGTNQTYTEIRAWYNVWIRFTWATPGGGNAISVSLIDKSTDSVLLQGYMSLSS